MSRASSSSSSFFRAPPIPKADPGVTKDFIYAHPPRSSPPKPAPADAREPGYDDPVGRPIEAPHRIKDAGPVNPFDNTELQRLKECPLCKEDWARARKLSRAKWVRPSAVPDCLLR
jgi:hypothetical protein